MSDCIFPDEHRDSQGCLPFAYFRELGKTDCTPKVGECFTMGWGSAPKPELKPNKEKKMSDAVKNPDAVIPAETKAIEVQPPSADEIGKLVEQSGGGAAGVAVALIAVAGGGAAMKFYSDFSKNKYEEKMEKLRFEGEAQKSNNGDHTAC